MKSLLSKAVMLVAFAAALVSFSTNFGGEGFEVYLNGKVLLQQFGKDVNSPKNLQLGTLQPQDKLTIRFYHCGQPGKDRVLTLKDTKDHILKVWRYKNPTSSSNEMLCISQDIIGLQKAGNSLVKLYYSSSEVPEGKWLVNFVAGR